MSKKYPGGFISKNPVEPTTSAAPGIWTIDQAAYYTKQGTWPTPPLIIGQVYGGGFFAGQISTTANGGVADYNLVVGPLSTAQTSTQWKTSSSSTTGTDSVIDGQANSAVMNNSSHPAGQFCGGLTIGGFSDWYMPSKNELEVCYYNLKPTTGNNSTSYGVNQYSIPARGSNYTTGTPAQTSAADFQNTGAEDFDAAVYWSSTQNTGTIAWLQTFSSGSQASYYYKVATLRVRAIRRVAV